MAAVGAAGLLAPLASCDRRPRADLVLYSSVDDYLLRHVVDAFEAETGLHVDVLGDTEATKTTGLMQRLLAEKDAPRADVWWSSEPFASIRLAREGVLEPYTSEAAEATFDGGWPADLKATDGTWYAFAQRARVICYNPDLIEPEDVPTSIAELAFPRWKENVGLARPRFGTTRGHMAAICATDGPDALAAWLVAMRANSTLVFTANSDVARGVAFGRCPLGLCDTDDVWVMQSDGRYPIGLVYERREPETATPFGPGHHGPMVVPNTIGVVRGGAHPEAARRFVDFALRPGTERMIARSDSHNLPVHPEVAAEFPEYAIPNPWVPDYEAAADSMDEAMRLCSEIFAGW